MRIMPGSSTICLALVAGGIATATPAPYGRGTAQSVGLNDPASAATPQDERLRTQDEYPTADPHLMPPQPPVTTAGRRVRFGPFESVQVNVNRRGRNIVGDAANEPSMAVDPRNPDVMAIGWRQFDSVESNFRQAGYAFSRDGGQVWTFPGVLEPGVFRSDPVLDSDVSGVFYYYSLKADFTCDLWRSSDGGQTWIDPRPAFGQDKPWLVVDKSGGIGSGHVYASFKFQFFTRSTDGGLTFIDPVRVPGNPIRGTIAVGPEGEVYVAGEAGGQIRVARSLNAREREATPVFDQLTAVDLGGVFIPRAAGPNPGGLAGQVWVATDMSAGPRRGAVYVLCPVDSDGADPMDVMIARSDDRMKTFAPPVRINDDVPDTDAWQWFAALSVAPSGRIDVSWYDTRSSGTANLCAPYYAYSTDGGGKWSPNLQAGPAFDSWVGWPRQNKIGDYTHQVSDVLGARLAYTATYNGEQDVYFAYLKLDCNANGFHDGDDIAAGRSQDTNGNWIPDECEPDIPCERIRRLGARCSDGKLKAVVRSELPPGTVLTLDNNGARREVAVNDRGRARAKWNSQAALHRITLVDCPEFRREVACE